MDVKNKMPYRTKAPFVLMILYITACPQMVHKAFNYMLAAEEMLALLCASFSPHRVGYVI